MSVRLRLFGVIRRTRPVARVTGLLVVLVVCPLPPAVHAGYATRLWFPFDIGDARSLPWGADETRGLADYNLATLLPDVERLLTPHTPVIVRLETLRRAVLYASRDRKVAQLLFERIDERAGGQSGTAAHPDPLRLLDAAFVTDLLWQLGQHSNPPFTEQSRVVRGLVDHRDGNALIQKRLALMPKEPQFMFAIALLAGVRHLGEASFTEYAREASAAADRDALLARNLGRIYADRLSDLTGATDSGCVTSSVVHDTAPKDRNAGSVGPATWFVNGSRSIWAGPVPENGWKAGGTVFSGDRAIRGQKTYWVRPPGAQLAITGRRIDVPGPPLEAHIPCCYPTGFQIVALYFPSEGCWEVSATAAETELTFVTRVRPSQAK